MRAESASRAMTRSRRRHGDDALLDTVLQCQWCAAPSGGWRRGAATESGGVFVCPVTSVQTYPLVPCTDGATAVL